MATVTTSNLPEEIKTYYKTALLMAAVPNFVHNLWGKKSTRGNEAIPRSGGKTVEWRRFSTLSAVTSPLAEAAFGYGGTPPAPVNPTVTTVTATVDQYGAYMEYTDVVDFAAIDPLLTEFSQLLGYQAGQSADLLARNLLQTNLANHIYANGTADTSITSADIITYSLIVQAWARLTGANARPITEGKFVMVAHPYTVADMMRDNDISVIFQADATAGKENPFRTARVGTLVNQEVYQSSLAYVNVGGGAGTPPADVYYTLVLGEQAFGTTGFAGREPRDIVPEDPQGNNTGRRVMPVDLIFNNFGAFDPFDQIATVAWKFAWGGAILDSNFGVWIHHAATAA